MDTQQFMQEFVARKVSTSPSEAFNNPQVELLTEMSRDADLETRVEQISKGNKSARSPTPDVEEGSVNTPEDTPRAAFEESFTPDAEPSDPHESETPGAVAGDPLESVGDFATPVSPAGSRAPHAEPSPVFQEESEQAEPSFVPESSSPQAEAEHPEESAQEHAVPEEPEIRYTRQAVPSQIFQDFSTPGARITTAPEMTEARMVPEGLPFDFDRMMELARNQVQLPQIKSSAYSAGPPDLLAGLPDFDDITTQPSTDFADAKLNELSRFWKQWERRT